MTGLRTALVLSVGFFIALGIAGCEFSVGSKQPAPAPQPPPMPPPEEPLPPPVAASPIAGPAPYGSTVEPLPPPTDTGFVAAPAAEPSASADGRTMVPGLAGPAAVPATLAAPGGATTALDLAGAMRSSLLANPDARVVSAKRKDKKGIVSYEIELLGAGNTITELELDGAGNPIPGKTKGPKLDPKMGAAAAVAAVRAEDAIATALATYPGVAEEVELSHSGGFATWEVEVTNAAGKDVKIKVDAGSGKVVPY